MLTVLMWMGITYLFWVIGGYLAFRFVNKVHNGKTMFEHHTGYTSYGREVYGYKDLTPKMGLCYMLFGGAGILVVAFIRMVFLAISSRDFNRSITVNRFFGIK